MHESAPTLPTIAVFDVDDTLIKGDSFWPFLARIAGWRRTIMALYYALISFAWDSTRHRSKDFRTFVKASLMNQLLRGVKKSRSDDAAEKLRIWRQWNEPMRDKLMAHHNKGHHIVIASGGLDLYLPEILKDIPYHKLICTEVEVENGVITGVMTNGNCVRDRKAELVAAYIAAHGPFGVSWGYGNYPHDVPMLNLVQHRVLV